MVDVAGMLITSPLVLRAWLRGLPHRTQITGLYAAGYSIIALALIVDAIYNPPLYLHGFTPGIGIGLLLGSFGLYLHDAASTRRKGSGATQDMRQPPEP
jgi:hypothetical protein